MKGNIANIHAYAKAEPHVKASSSVTSAQTFLASGANPSDRTTFGTSVMRAMPPILRRGRGMGNGEKAEWENGRNGEEHLWFSVSPILRFTVSIHPSPPVGSVQRTVRR